MTTDSRLLEMRLRDIVQVIEEGRITCLRCINFDAITERCKLVDQRPPARVIAYGCPKFSPDIPF